MGRVAVSAGIALGIGIEIKEDLSKRRKARYLAAALADQKMNAKGNLLDVTMPAAVSNQFLISSVFILRVIPHHQ